jgi:hypothetical protein
MPKSKLTRTVICALAAATLFGTAQSGVAKARPTYEEAFKLCTKHLNQVGIPKSNQGQRYSAGAGCMHQYGYRI